MKPLQIAVCTLVLSLASTVRAAAPPSPEIQQLLVDGQTAYMKGDLAKAKGAFEMVYEIDPRNTVAIGFLKQIKIAQENQPKGPASQEKALGAIIIPKVEFRDATLREALDVLRKKASELSNGKLSANFVVPSGEPTDSIRVTLSLQSIPFNDAVHYLGKVANFEFSFEKYAIVGKPIAGTTAAATTTPTQAPSAQ